MNSLELQFIAESRELLEAIGEALLKFERDPDDTDNLNSLFRQVHTLKGNCGLFDTLAPLGQVLHAAEDTLDKVREGKYCLSLQDTDLLMEMMDFVIAGLDSWECGTYQTSEELPKARQLAERIMSSRSAAPEDRTIDALAQGRAKESSDEPWLSELIDRVEHLAGRLVCVRYTPEPECFFKGEDPLQLVFSVAELEYIEILKTGTWDAQATFDFYRCQLEFVFVSTAPLAEVKRVFDYVPDQIILTEVTQTSRAIQQRDEVHAQVIPELTRSRLAQLWKIQSTMINMVDELDPGWKGKAGGAVAAIVALAKSVGRVAWANAAREILDVSLKADQLQPLKSWLANPPSELMPPAVEAATQVESKALQSAAAPVSTPTPVEHDSKAMAVLKVPREKIDRLMELIGEMVVAKNSLPYLASRAENEFACRELAREIKANHSVVNRIAEEMQDAIMQIRMLPVGTVFQRFPRLVRDLSKRLGKQIRLEISGEETEADKNMIESLSEPLIHLLRNSLDHGIELPGVREKAGKSPEGLIAIHAWQDSDRVYISIRDDGAGIDPKRLKQKALEKNLLAQDKLDSMQEKDLLQLIFLPGFSTASQVSEVSGRGVGMDVVRSAIARVNGQVDLQSVIGQGTTLTLSLPLSMAVNKVMMIDVAGQQFGLPMEVVVETVRVPIEDIHHIQNQLAIVLRGKITPLLSLHGLLGVTEQPVANSENELAVLVCRVGQDTLGVIVDGFDSTIDILLRPLDGVLANMHQYAGSALLGDGTVLLILNLTEMMSCQ
jgi:two-component system, chemotaxis family, sensor kinase CheA